MDSDGSLPRSPFFLLPLSHLRLKEFVCSARPPDHDIKSDMSNPSAISQGRLRCHTALKLSRDNLPSGWHYSIASVPSDRDALKIQPEMRYFFFCCSAATKPYIASY
jgi:hypothetical protein